MPLARLLRLLLLALAITVAILAGCARPEFQPMGPILQTPALEAGSLQAADGARLPLRTWLPDAKPRAVIVALHGMNDHANAFDMPADYWADYGIATYAYDQRGFGAAARPGIWSDTRSMAADLDAAVTAVADRHPGVPLYVLGESMGGAVIAAALAGETDAGQPPLAARIDGAILSAPALWGRDIMNPFYRFMLWASVHTVPGMAVKPPASLKIRPSDNIEMLRALASDPLVLKETRFDALAGMLDLMSDAYASVPSLPGALPMLVLYGRHEEVLAPSAMDDMMARWDEARTGRPALRIAIYDRGYHMLLRDLCAPDVWRDVQAWIEDGAAGLPSGSDQGRWNAPPDDPAAMSCPATKN